MEPHRFQVPEGFIRLPTFFRSLSASIEAADGVDMEQLQLQLISVSCGIAASHLRLYGQLAN